MVTSLERVDNHNNNNSYIALYPVSKNLQVRGAVPRFFNIKIRLTIKLKKYKYYKCIHQYQNDKKARKHSGREGRVQLFSLESKT